MQKRKIFLNLLILIGLGALVITGWIVGHIYRYSIPEFQHPRELIPDVKIGSFSDKPTGIAKGNPIANREVPAWMT